MQYRFLTYVIVVLIAAGGGTTLMAQVGKVVATRDSDDGSDQVAAPEDLKKTTQAPVEPSESILSEEVPQAPPNPHPPPYTLLRFNEDYTYLADPENRTDPFDLLKYIPLNPKNPKSYLSLGGEIRERFENFRDPGFGADGTKRSHDFLQRVTLDADLHLDERIRFFVQGISGLQFGNEDKPPVNQDPIDLQQAFGDFVLGDPDAHDPRLTIRGGRFEMTYGSGRLVALRAGPNIPFKFDGLELIGAHEKSRIYAFITRPVNEDIRGFDDEDDHQTFWGTYGTTPLGGPLNTGIDLYYLGLRLEDAEFADGTAIEERHTVGTRIFGKAHGFDYDIEPVFQFGHFGNRDIRAWTIANDAGYTIDNLPWKPRIGSKFDIASGDLKGGDHTLGTFNPLFFKAGYFSDASLIRPSNIVDIHPSIQLRPKDSVVCTFASDVLWRFSKNDAVYAPSGAIELPSGPGISSIGTTGEVALQWNINRHLLFTASYVHLFASSYVRNAQGGDVDFVGMWLTFVW